MEKKSKFTEEEKGIRNTYLQWKFSKENIFGIQINVTKEQYVNLWVNSDKWEQRGPSIGCYTVQIAHDVKVVEIEHCSIVQRLATSLRPASEPIPKRERKRKEPKKSAIKDDISPIRKAMYAAYRMWIMAYKKHKFQVMFTKDDYADVWEESGKWEFRGRELGQYYLELIGNTKVVSKEHVKVMQREPRLYAKTLAATEKCGGRPSKQKIVEEEKAYRKDTPMQRVINELEKIPVTNYKLYNLRTKKELAAGQKKSVVS